MPDRLPGRPLLLAFALFLVGAYGLNQIRAYNATYNAATFVLPDGTPARLVLPGPREGRSLRPRLPEGVPRPPLAVLTHGIISNKEMMSGLANALARHGVAVLTMDWVGHGANAIPFRRPALQSQAEYVIAYMREHYSDVVDPNRVALLGHSMGGGATLAYAARSADLDAAVAISAGWLRPGPVPPRNVLFVYATGDLPGLGAGVEEAMAELSGMPAPDHDVTYGRFEDGTARRMTAIPRADHVTILYTPGTARAIVHWLGEIWPLGADRTFGDPRLPWLGLVACAAIALTCVGVRVLRPWLPVLDQQPHDRWPVRLAVLVAALTLSMLALTAGTPFEFLGVWGGDYLTGFFGLAGLLLCGYTAATGAADWRLFWPDWRATLGGALALALIAYVLLGGAATHSAIRLTLPPHRVPVALAAFLPTALACIGQDALTKKGGLGQAAAMSAAAVVAIVAVFLVALSRNLAPVAVMLVLPATALLLLVFEIPSLAIFHYTRNYFLSGLYRAALLSTFSATLFPVQ